MLQGRHDAALQIDRRQGNAYFNRGISWLMDRQFRAAIADFTQVIRLGPKKWDGYWLRGDAHYELKQWQRAIDDYTVALRLNQGLVKAYLRRGKALMRLLSWRRASTPRICRTDTGSPRAGGGVCGSVKL